jgi:cystathionine beta-synthase
MAELLRMIGSRPVITVDVETTVDGAMALFKEHGISQMPVVDDGKLAGILTELDLLQHLVSGRADKSTTVAEVMVRKVHTVSAQASAGDLPSIFERGEVAIVVDDRRHVTGIVTKMDLIELLAARGPARTSSRMPSSRPA